jgi:YbbR domain-containing protein
MFIRLYSNNWGLKLLALGLAILLFSVVHSDTDAQRAIFMDVVVLLPPPNSGKMLISEVPSQVKVTLTGSRSKLSSLSRDDFSPVQMDLRDGKSGYFYMDSSEISIGSGVQVMAISPSIVPLTWAVAAEKRLAVHVHVVGGLAKNLSLRGEVDAVPSYASVRGPKHELDDITTVSTEPVSLEGLGAGGHTRRVPLQRLPEHVTYSGEDAVEVRINVVPLVAERTLGRLPVAAVGEGRASVRPPRVDVALRGPEDVMNRLSVDQIVPYVEFAKMPGPATSSYEVRLRGAPEGVEVVRIVPPSVLVRTEGK